MGEGSTQGGERDLKGVVVTRGKNVLKESKN
jgi:hypothetical protein